MDIEWGLDERTDKRRILRAQPETLWFQKIEEKRGNRFRQRCPHPQFKPFCPSHPCKYI
ncbi:MAG: hypothetical protein QF682_12415 [Candidatus Thermoplasmatota archaeon]|nr:hypothetical protein [Candidatus Thermoplasmatota archaeon]